MSEKREEATGSPVSKPDCPVAVFVGMNVSVRNLRGFPCAVCGDDLSYHPFEPSSLVPLDKAYAVNRSAIGELAFDTSDPQGSLPTSSDVANPDAGGGV